MFEKYNQVLRFFTGQAFVQGKCASLGLGEWQAAPDFTPSPAQLSTGLSAGGEGGEVRGVTWIYAAQDGGKSKLWHWHNTYPRTG